MAAVTKVDVPKTRGTVHDVGALRSSPRGMAGKVPLSIVSLGFKDSVPANFAVDSAPHQQLANQPAGQCNRFL